MTMLLSMMVLTSCSKCVKPPKLEQLDKVKTIRIRVQKGQIDPRDTLGIFKALKSFRIGEDFYRDMIERYNKMFVKKSKGMEL